MEFIFRFLSSAVAFLPTGQAGLNTFSAKGKSISRLERPKQINYFL